MNSNLSSTIHPESQIHPNALIDEGAKIGPRSMVWAFAHVLSGAVIGEDCNICDHTFIEGRVIVGDRVTVKSGVYLWDGLIVEDDVFIGPAAVFTNDLKPRSRQQPDSYAKTILKRGCSLGANSTILAGTTIGAWAMVGAGSVVTKSIPDFGAAWGNPAIFRYWICKCTTRMDFESENRFVCPCERIYEIDYKTGTVNICP